MASLEAKLPIDTSVSIPPSILRAAEAADAAHKAAYGEPAAAAAPDAAAPAPAPVSAAPAAEPAPVSAAPAAEPAPVSAAPAAEPADTGNWEHRYHSMKGRFDQSQVTIGAMQEQMAELGDELLRTQAAVRTRAPVATARTEPVRLVTKQDVDTYGPELIDVVTRAAREAIAPELNEVRDQTRKVSQRVAQTTTQGLYAQLDTEIPDWRAINVDPRFKAWCRSPDVYSGEVRGKLLNAAFQAANAPRVIAFFKGFHDEEVATGNAPDPRAQPQPLAAPRTAAVPLETLTAPGRAKPASGDTQVPADKPVFTRAQIAIFYANVRAGAYSGRDADKAKDEQAIFAAQRDGRVRG